MEGDLDMTVREDELDEKGQHLIDWVKPVGWLWPNAEVYEAWEVDGEDEDVDLIDLYASGNAGGNAQRIPMRCMGKRRLTRTTMRMWRASRRMWRARRRTWRAGRRVIMMSI